MGTLVSTGQITLTDTNDYIFQGTTAPLNPIKDVTVWIDTSLNPPIQKIWNGTAWVIVNDVKIGGRNLFSAKKSNVAQISNASSKEFTLASWGGVAMNNSELISKLKSGQVYTFSFDAELIAKSNGTVIAENLVGFQIYSSLGGFNSQLRNNSLGLTVGSKASFSFTFECGILNSNHILYIYTRRYENTSVYDTIKFTNVKLERGNKATDWTPAPEDVDDAINAAQTSANTANSLLSDIANDNILTPSEKQSTKKEWDIIVSEKNTVETQATSLGVSTTSYVNAYNSLNSYITPLLANLTVNSTIVGSDFRANFKNYYDAKIALLKAVTDKLKSNTDFLQTQLDSESAKVINLENKTDFLTGTTIEGNAIATGTLLVGDGNGTNAMICGITDQPNGESIRFAAGKPYAQKYLSPFQVLDNGMVRFVNPVTGQKTFELGYNQATGKVVFDIYDENGVKIATIGSQGITFTGYIQESFDTQYFTKLETNTFEESAIINSFKTTLRKRIETNSPRTYSVYMVSNKTAYLYDAGRNFETSSNIQYIGYHNSANKFDSFIDNGIYMVMAPEELFDASETVYYSTTAYRMVNGKVNDTMYITVVASLTEIN